MTFKRKFAIHWKEEKMPGWWRKDKKVRLFGSLDEDPLQAVTVLHELLG